MTGRWRPIRRLRLALARRRMRRWIAAQVGRPTSPAITDDEY